MPQLIALEGIDGVGKATQAALLAQHARRVGFRVATFALPAANESGAVLRTLLAGEFGPLPAPPVVSLLFTLNRLEAMCTQMAAALAPDAACDLVLCDRYSASNAAYTMARLPLTERADCAQRLAVYEFEILKLPRPDLSIWLALGQQTAATRRRERGRTADRNEDDSSLQQLAHNSYATLTKTPLFGPWLTLVCDRADGSALGADEVHQRIWSSDQLQTLLKGIDHERSRTTFCF